jgi:hypothetical protein
MSFKKKFFLFLIFTSPITLINLFYLEENLYNYNKRYSISRHMLLMPFGFIRSKHTPFEFFERYRSSAYGMHQSAQLLDFPKINSEDELNELANYIQDQRNRHKEFEFRGGRHISKNLIVVKYHAVNFSDTFLGFTYFILIERDDNNHLKVIYEDAQKVTN